MAFNSTTETIVGDKLMLFIKVGNSYTPIAFGTSCGIDISADTIDTSNKMSGNWKEFLTGQLGYTVSSESLMSATEGHLSFTKLKELMANRTPIAFAISKTAGSPGFGESEQVLKGEAIITALNIAAQNATITTCSCTLQGTGALEDGAPADSGDSTD